MPDSGQCASTENVAATEPPGAEQTIANQLRGALCIFCGEPGELVSVTWCETPPDEVFHRAHGYCADFLGVRA